MRSERLSREEPTPIFDLTSVERWFSRNSPPNSTMTVLLMQVERIVRSAVSSLPEFSYEVRKTNGVVEVSFVDFRTREAPRTIVSLCCHSGRFFKQYGPSQEERVFFSDAIDAAQYLIFVLNGSRGRRRRLGPGTR